MTVVNSYADTTTSYSRPGTQRSYLFLLCKLSLTQTALLVLLFCQSLYAAVPSAYTVSVNGKRYKLVYLLEVDRRLAVNEHDVTNWGLQENVGAPADIPGVAENLKLYWLDEIDRFDLLVDRSTNWVELRHNPTTNANELVIRHKNDKPVLLEHGWGTDVTYRIASFSQPGNAPLLEFQGQFGVSMGRFGRLRTRLDIDNHVDVTAPGSAGRQWQSRLEDTVFQHNFDSGYQLSLGQLNSGSAGLSGGLNLLGLSVGTNVLGRARVSQSNRLSSFENLITLQQPADLEVRVNGQLVVVREVGIGRLSVRNIPIRAGANQIELLLRYADGSVERIERRVVGGTELIGDGQSEVSFALGTLEDQSHPGNSPRYDAPYAALSFSHGIDADNTIVLSSEARGGAEKYTAIQSEWAGRLPANAIARATLGISNAQFAHDTTLSVSEQQSRIDNRTGVQSEISLEFARQRSSLFIGLNYSDKDYLTLRQSGFTVNPKLSSWVNWQYAMPDSKGLSAFYQHEENHDSSVAQSLSVSYRAKLGQAKLSLSVGYDDSILNSGINAHAMITMPLHPNRSQLTARSYSNAQGRQVSARLKRSLASNSSGSGWAAQIQQSEFHTGGSQTTGAFSGVVRGQYGEVRVNTRYAGDDWHLSGEARGSLVLADNNLYVTRPVGSSFVLIDTGEAIGATVSANHRQITKVDNNGRAFIPFVPSYSSLQLGIDPDSLSANMLGSTLSKRFAFAPGFAKIEIPIRKALHANVTFLDGSGNPWPPGTEIRTHNGIEDNQVRGYVGQRGRAYVADFRAGETLKLVADQRMCSFILPLPNDRAGLVEIDELSCNYKAE